MISSKKTPKTNHAFSVFASVTPEKPGYIVVTK